VREAVDDFRRGQRDKEINSRLYKKLVPSGFELIPSWKIKVGDLICVDQGKMSFLYFFFKCHLSNI